MLTTRRVRGWPFADSHSEIGLCLTLIGTRDMLPRKLIKPLLRIREGRNGLSMRYVTSRSFSNGKNEAEVVSSNASNDIEEDDINKPIRFSQTMAAFVKAQESQQTWPDAPDCQNAVVWCSVASFMLYFFVLREENDIDQLLEKNLSDHLGE